MSAGKFLNDLVQAIPAMESLAFLKEAPYESWLLDLAKKIKGDDELFAQLTKWLDYRQGMESNPESSLLPEPLREFLPHLIRLREAFH